MPTYQYEVARDGQARVHFHSNKTDMVGIINDAISHFSSLIGTSNKSISLLIYDSAGNRLGSFGFDPSASASKQYNFVKQFK